MKSLIYEIRIFVFQWGTIAICNANNIIIIIDFMVISVELLKKVVVYYDSKLILFRMERASVISSAYSSSPPTAIPLLNVVTFTPLSPSFFAM